MRESLIPANTKKSTLILGLLRPVDAIILGIGIAVTVIALMVVNGQSTWQLLLACIPAIIAAVLILPIPNYHNTLVGIQSILNFYNERRNYVWKGWCACDEFKDDK